eukprot:1530900-Rhodomonas_salina.1
MDIQPTVVRGIFLSDCFSSSAVLYWSRYSRSLRRCQEEGRVASRSTVSLSGISWSWPLGILFRTVLRTRYDMPGTDVGCVLPEMWYQRTACWVRSAMDLRAWYALRGTDSVCSSCSARKRAGHGREHA